MNISRTAISTALTAALGLAGVALAPTTASAAIIADGSYNLVIQTTPTAYVTGIGNIYVYGNQTIGYNSSFTFGATPSLQNGSKPMTDNGTGVTGSDGYTRGSGIGGDGYAGIMEVVVSGSTFSITGSSMAGTIDQTSGLMTLTPTDRNGAISSPNTLFNATWNDPAGGTNNSALTSGTVNAILSDTNGNTSLGTVTGRPLTDLGSSVDGDLLNDFSVTLIGGGQVGAAWGSFEGAAYFEVWKAQLLTNTTGASGFHVDTVFGTAGGNFAQYEGLQNPVPVPAAVWLFGSGLVGLVGVARRKKTST